MPISIESDIQNEVEQGYLHNVTPGEVAITVSSQGNKPLSSVKAQAVSARTYAYYHINISSTINNSNQFQVYIPYQYAQLTQVQQQRVNDAVSEALYMTPFGNTTDPIRAHFGADNGPNTTDGGEIYLQSVYDPINDAYGCLGPNGERYENSHPSCGTGNGGMSSRGASRWGFGHTSSRGPAAPDDSNYPGDSNGDGNFWSVQWDEAAQILFHYYSNSVLRNQYEQITVPGYRWYPLIIDWTETGTGEAPAMENGGSGTHNVDVTLQNTGIYTWKHISDGGAAYWYLSYRWRKGDNVQEGIGKAEIIEDGQSLSVSTSHHRTVTLSVYDPPNWGEGDYTLQLDMLAEVQGSGNIIWFSDEQSEDWFTYDMEVSVSGGGSGGQDEYVYLPLILKSEPPPPAPTPTPSNCTWVDNVLDNRDFNDWNEPLNHWTVWIDTTPNGGFQDRELYSGINYLPDNGRYGAFLGRENDCDGCQPDGGDNADQYIAQSVVINADEVEAIAIEYSYCLTTQEESPLEFDKFIVDVQLGGLTGNSILPQTPNYNNLNASSNCTAATGGANWRRRGEPISEGGDGYLIVSGIDEQYDGDIELALVFYSDVNDDRITSFYFDSVKFKVCEK